MSNHLRANLLKAVIEIRNASKIIDDFFFIYSTGWHCCDDNIYSIM